MYDDLTVTENLAFFARVRGARQATPSSVPSRPSTWSDHDDQVVAPAQRGRAVAGQPGRRPARRARPAGARRADGRTRPRAAPGPLDAVPPAGGRRRRRLRLQPRHGRGRPLRPAAADARRRDHRRRHTRAEIRREHRFAGTSSTRSCPGQDPAHRRHRHRDREVRHDPRITLAVAGRVLTQLRRDHRTMAMLLLLPTLLMTLLWWMFKDTPGAVFDRDRPRPARAVPVLHHVPGHQRHHAARAVRAAPWSGCCRCRWASSTSCSATRSPSG